jgi:hypothetical protein
MPQLAIEAPPSNEPLTVDYNYDHSVRTVFIHTNKNNISYRNSFSMNIERVLIILHNYQDDRVKYWRH